MFVNQSKETKYMQTIAHIVQPDPDILASVEALRRQRPALDRLYSAFGGLLARKAALASHLADQIPVQALALDSGRLAQGVPLLAGVDLSPLRPALATSTSVILPLLRESFPAIAQDINALDAALTQEQLDCVTLARAVLDGDENALTDAASRVGIAPGLLMFALRAVLSPVLSALVKAVKPSGSQHAWGKGHCSVCGALPGMASLSKVGDLGSEYLRGGGGAKHLHCSLCTHTWRAPRGTCPVCENSDKDQLEYLRVENEKAERVDICRKCGLYMPCLDLREVIDEPAPEVSALGMAYLDILAQEKGFRPAAWLPWNQAC